jgi:hypothetical protein
MRSWSVLLAIVVLSVPVTSRAEEPAPGAKPPAPSATPAPPAAAAPAATKPDDDAVVGEVITLPYNRTASYGPTRVRGPNVNLSDQGNGEWKGNIKDLDGVFRVTEKRIAGGNLNVVVDRDGEEWTAQGTVNGRRVRIVMEKDGFVARYDDRLYDLKRVAPDLWATPGGGPAIRVKGDAGRRDPYFPQFVFALLAVL